MYKNIKDYIEKNQKKDKFIANLAPDVLLDLLHLPKLIVHEDVLNDMKKYLEEDIPTLDILVEKEIDEDGDIEFHDDLFLLDLPYNKDETAVGYILDDDVFLRTEICEKVLSKYKDLEIISEYE
ncbi:Glycosyl transferase, family 2 [Moritella viscosa]|uniref:hypothetical protein n=1 Tax=Moritella viscosa TaxID=80854 RepID=UPI0005090231|nr:hypothetical protein [Moritella viscosa]CED60725.1 putative uncharacterized protein [Moritella viscosa]SHO12066.1 Glycosyl transferase, family 2 [Moritella viscosa]SHO23002.1 Glycosyl transferase, family 2 [Moritella viscosa]